MKKKTIGMFLLIASLCFGRVVFAEPSQPCSEKEADVSQGQKSISDNFDDIKKGVTTEKEVLAWFGKPQRVDEYLPNKENAKVLKYRHDCPLYSSKFLQNFAGHSFSWSNNTPMPTVKTYEFEVYINKRTGVVEATEKKERFSGIEEDIIPCRSGNYKGVQVVYKPVIYLYPVHEQPVSVRLKYQGDIFISYPQYDESLQGWEVIAYPDGRIVNSADGQEYSYIFWEGMSSQTVHYDLSKGFVVEGEKVAAFLRDILKKMGLTPKEYNEFIVYWYPKLKNNKYNLICFAYAEYEESAKLGITPKPDSILRVFMVTQPLEEKIDIAPQEIKPFRRSGFTVVEWGGTELK